MKKIFNIMIAAAAICFAAACQKEEVKSIVDPAIVGEWHLETTEVDGEIMNYPYDVYLSIFQEGRFEIYQKSGSQTRYTKFTGTCKSEGTTLSGVYSSNTPWNDTYTATVESGKLVLLNSDGMERQEYVKEALSQEAKLAANISTKAEDAMAPIL